MSETFDPEEMQSKVRENVAGVRREVTHAGKRAQRDMQRIAQENGPYILIGAVVVAALIGFLVARRDEADKREQWATNFLNDAKQWLNENSRKVADPIREQIDSVTDQAAEYGKSFNKFRQKKQKKFFDLF